MAAFFEWLQGKKTYFLAALAGVDVFGAKLGWWEPDSLRSSLEGILMFVTLRAGVTNSVTVK